MMGESIGVVKREGDGGRHHDGGCVKVEKEEEAETAFANQHDVLPLRGHENSRRDNGRPSSNKFCEEVDFSPKRHTESGNCCHHLNGDEPSRKVHLCGCGAVIGDDEGGTARTNDTVADTRHDMEDDKHNGTTEKIAMGAAVDASNPMRKTTRKAKTKKHGARQPKQPLRHEPQHNKSNQQQLQSPTVQSLTPAHKRSLFADHHSSSSPQPTPPELLVNETDPIVHSSTGHAKTCSVIVKRGEGLWKRQPLLIEQSLRSSTPSTAALRSSLSCSRDLTSEGFVKGGNKNDLGWVPEANVISAESCKHQPSKPECLRGNHSRNHHPQDLQQEQEAHRQPQEQAQAQLREKQRNIGNHHSSSNHFSNRSIASSQVSTKMTAPTFIPRMLNCRAVDLLKHRLWKRQEEYDEKAKHQQDEDTAPDDSDHLDEHLHVSHGTNLRTGINPDDIETDTDGDSFTVECYPDTSYRSGRRSCVSTQSSQTPHDLPDQHGDDHWTLREMIGDVGLTLFNPLDEAVLLPPPSTCLLNDGPVRGISDHHKREDNTSVIGCLPALSFFNGRREDESPLIDLKGVATSTTCSWFVEDDDVDGAHSSIHNNNDNHNIDVNVNNDDTNSNSKKTKRNVNCFSACHPRTASSISSDDDHSCASNNADAEPDDMFIFNHEVFPVQLMDESPDVLRLSPRILSESMLHQIVNEAIPRSLRIYKWERIFCISRDGDAFITMLEKCSTYKNTLIVTRTTSGQILGGFASDQWRGQEGRQERKSFFGTGTSFLFSTHPTSQSEDPESQLTIYPWTGTNDYCQICDVDRQYIAMGGGDGDFGLIVEESFLCGSTGHCATFGNPPLIPGIDGSFDVQDFEVWGMVPLFPSVVKPLSKRYSGVSLLGMDRP